MTTKIRDVDLKRPVYRLTTLLAIALICAMSPSISTASDSHVDNFESTVAPILMQRCIECHNTKEAAGELDLTSRQGLLAGGESGPVIDAAELKNSLLLEHVTNGEMPPDKQGVSQKLADAEIDRLRVWIHNGASWPNERKLDLFEKSTDTRAGRDWWSLQPIQRPPLPGYSDSSLVSNAVDAFVLARLDDAAMAPAPPADRRVLIRRLYQDLVGIPPDPSDIDAFVIDANPLAYERLVDSLLASPHFGERWARYWLDLARFAETCGYERDQVKPGIWKYRDWVVRSLNEDKPYDRFVIEQLAGDELADRNEQTVIATGFLRAGTWNDEPNDPHEYKYERLEDMVHVTSTAFLAMTVKCARCHDHKFDAISQTDYYRMASAFWAGFIEPGSRDLLGGPNKEQLGYDVFGWTDRGREPPPLHLLMKGDPKRPQEVVLPGHLSTVSVLNQPIPQTPASAKTSERRLQMARWIVDQENPLTARVLVNRLWQNHFGRGLVRTPNNFGFTGAKPTHPQLLDYLADTLIRNNWEMKSIHRMLLLSRTYRQSSVHPQQQAYETQDAGNHLLWRANRRRLDAESLRDAMLASSNQLDLRLGGESFRPTIAPEALEGLSRKASAWTASPLQEQRRRSLYIFSQRSLLPPMLTTFGFSDTTLPCGRRDVSTVAPQALALLNNEFVHRQSEALAQRVMNKTDDDPRQQIKQAWRFTLGRPPRQAELGPAVAHYDRQLRRFQSEQASAKLRALASVCHVLLNTNEFIYVD